MKSTQVWLLVLAALVIGLALGYWLGGVRGIEMVDLPLQRSCSYNGEVYKDGDGFVAEDGCNTCSCVDGQVACTLMACEPAGL